MASIDRRNHPTACSQIPRWSFAQARGEHPDVGHRVARAEAQGFGNVTLRFIGVTDQNLPNSDHGIGVGEISILRQRVLTFGNALRGALCEYLDKSQQQMAARMVWDQGQGSGRLRSAAKNAAVESVTNILTPAAASTRADPDERVYVAGIGGERAIEKAACLRHILRGHTLIEPSQTLKIKVHRVRGRGLFRASRLSGDKLGHQRACQPRDNFVLHVEEVDDGLIEALGPEMIACLCAYELHIDAHAIAAALNAALEDVANVQLAADLLQIDCLPL